MQTLLLPGMDGTGRLFAPLLRAIAGRFRTRVVSYKTDAVETYDDLVHAFELPQEPVCLVGESFSGPIAIRLASMRPDRVRGVILAASFATSPLSFASSIASFAAPRLPRATKFAMRTMLLNGGYPELAEEVHAATLLVSKSVLAGRIREIARVDERHTLRSTAMPLLFLRARHDRLIGKQQMRIVQEERRDTQIHELDAPHLVLQTQPARAADLIERFVGGLSSR